MKKVKELTDLLECYEAILLSLESKRDQRVLREFIEILRPIREIELSELYNRITNYNGNESNVSKGPNAFDYNVLKHIYDNVRISQDVLSDEEKLILQNFEGKNPKIRQMIFGSLENLYEFVCNNNNNTHLTIKELNFILYYRFGIKYNRRKKKTELMNDLKKYIYQSNHFDDLRDSYSRDDISMVSSEEKKK